jgi:hypothetical protein
MSDGLRREQDEAIEENNRSAVRMMLPFAVLVLGSLFCVFKVVNRSDPTTRLGKITPTAKITQ